MHKSSTDAGGIREPDRQSDANHSIVASDILSANPVLRAKIVQNCQLSNAAAEDGLAEVIRFLDLCAGADARLTPSRAVDDAWHELILCTKAYHEFCEARFGRFIHHHPGGTHASNREQYRATLDLYRRRFGRPDPRFWGDGDADCGACESIDHMGDEHVL